MNKYNYICEKCEAHLLKTIDAPKPPKTVKCEFCGGDAKLQEEVAE